MSLHALVLPLARPQTLPAIHWAALLRTNLGADVRLLLAERQHCRGSLTHVDADVVVLQTGRGAVHLPAPAVCGLELPAGEPVPPVDVVWTGRPVPAAIRRLLGGRVHLRSGGHTLIGDLVDVGHDCLAVSGFAGSVRWVPWSAVLQVRTGFGGDGLVTA